MIFCTCCLQNAVYGKALENGAADAPASAVSEYHDSYVVEPAWAGDLSKLPPGVARIVDGTRKLFEVRLNRLGLGAAVAAAAVVAAAAITAATLVVAATVAVTAASLSGMCCELNRQTG